MIDWASLDIVRDTASYTSHGHTSQGGDPIARAALIEILGPEEIARMVRLYVASDPCAQVVRSVLWMLKPEGAAKECLRLYNESGDAQCRRSAIQLFRVVASAELVAWLPTFWEDPDTQIQHWGASWLDQLVVRGELSAEEAEPWIQRAERHTSSSVRRMAAMIREELARGSRAPR